MTPLSTNLVSKTVLTRTIMQYLTHREIPTGRIFKMLDMIRLTYTVTFQHTRALKKFFK